MQVVMRESDPSAAQSGPPATADAHADTPAASDRPSPAAHSLGPLAGIGLRYGASAAGVENPLILPAVSSARQRGSTFCQ